MKTKDQLKPNYGPIYAAAMYPDLAAIFHDHGYALAVHGSLARDFDLIAVPWAEKIGTHGDVFKSIEAKFSVKVRRDSKQLMNHGRIAYTINIGFGECAVDLSFTGGIPLKVQTYYRFTDRYTKETRGFCTGDQLGEAIRENPKAIFESIREDQYYAKCDLIR